MKTTTIRVSVQTHQRITERAKWGEPLEDVIIRLLNSEQISKEKIDTFLNYLIEKEKELRNQSLQEYISKKPITEAIKKFKEVFP